MPIWPFASSPAVKDAERLLAVVIAASRCPRFYGEGRVPDTLEGRFELLALHAGLALFRLRGEADAGPLAQAFTDRLFRHLDAGLREAGFGDLAVPKRMARLAGSFYGRLDAYARALAAGNGPGLEAALARNIMGTPSHPFAANLASAAAGAARRQALAPLPALLDTWPAPAD